MDNMNLTSEQLRDSAFKLVDPKHKTVFAKSRTAFISISTVNFQVSMSAFLARKLGIMSGDRIGFLEHPAHQCILFIYKTTQQFRTVEVKIRKGTYTFNNKEIVKLMVDKFNLNEKYTGKIRLYVNHANPIKNQIQGEFTESVVMMQVYDIPHLRPDFETEEQKAAHVNFMKEQNYIVTNGGNN